MINLTLFLTAYLLLLPVTILNYYLVENKKGYFRSTALSIDIFANREYRTLWNTYLRTEEGYSFGIQGETISSALGKNERDGTLTITGKVLVSLLNKIDENHCIKSIDDTL